MQRLTKAIDKGKTLETHEGLQGQLRRKGKKFTKAIKELNVRSTDSF